MTLFYVIQSSTGRIVRAFATLEQAERFSKAVNRYADERHKTEVKTK